MRGDEDEGVARSLGEREVVGDGVYLVDELAGFRSLFKDQFSRGQCELFNHFAVRQEEFEVIRIRWTQAHPDSVSVPTRARGQRHSVKAVPKAGVAPRYHPPPRGRV